MRIFAFIFVVVSAVLLLAADITVVSEWSSPQELPDPVNSLGWEDSPQVTPNGNAVYFSYFRIDPILWGTKNKLRLGPHRPNWPKGEPFESYGAELYVARKVNGRWQTPEHLGTDINLPEDAEGGVWVSADERRILFTNGDGSPNRKRGIYFAEKQGTRWGKPVLASSIGFPFDAHDENPHLTIDEQTLFWESKRRGGRGKEDIWMSRKVNGAWTSPVNLGSNVNSGGTEGSPFSLDGRVLYWDDKGGGGGIFRSVLQADGNWSKKENVVKGHVGDPSLTQDGDLYFSAAAELSDKSGYNSSIMMAPKVGKPVSAVSPTATEVAPATRGWRRVDSRQDPREERRPARQERRERQQQDR